MNAASPWLQAKNLLAVRMDNAGDVVMLGPALRAIKTASPDARITLLASPAGTLAAALLPWIDDVVTWRAIWQDLGHLPWDPAREHDLVALLRERRFDGALVFTSFSQSPLPPAYACLLAGIPLRAGESAEFGGKVLSHEVKGTPHAAHQVERNLRLVELLGFPAADRALAVAITDAVRADAAARLRALGIDPGSPWALIHPGASAVARRYPPTAWGQVARALEARGVRTLLTGVEKERPLVEEAAAATPASAVLVGETGLPEYAALLERAAVVLCGNTLPLHLADAVGTPVVAAYSGTDLESQWAPRAVPRVLLRRPTPCHPCYRFDCPVGLACLAIPPAEVAEAALELLTAASRAPAAAADAVVPATGNARQGAHAVFHAVPSVVQEEPSPPLVGVARKGEHGALRNRADGTDAAILGTDAAGTGPSAARPANSSATLHPALRTRHSSSTQHRVPAAAGGPSTPGRIAVFQALALGDLICATPALRALREAFPTADIAMIALPWAEPVLRRSGLVDRFLPFPGWPGIAEASHDPARLGAFLSAVAAAPFDLAFQVHGSGSVSNGFVAALGAPRTVGYAVGPDDRLTDALPWDAAESEVGRWLRLVERAGASVPDAPRPEFPVSDDDRARAALLLREDPPGGGPLTGVHVGASDPARRWPPVRFAELAADLHRNHGARIVLTGTAGERALTAEVAATSGVPALDLAGRTDLFAFAALIESLDLLVTNDTGASHLAAATATPSVVLFGPTDPARWAPPDRARHLVVDALPPGADRASHGAAALAALPVAAVVAAAERLLAGRADRSTAVAKEPACAR